MSRPQCTTSYMVPGHALGMYRMIFGLLWFHMALEKAPWVVTDGHQFGWLYGWVEKEIAHPTFGWYGTFLQAVFLPYFTPFGYLSFFTEIALGLSLFLGLLTVLGGIGGGAWTINIALGSYCVPGEWPWLWFLLIAPHAVFAHSRSGRVFGLDQLLAEWLHRGQKAPSRFRQLVLRFA